MMADTIAPPVPISIMYAAARPTCPIAAVHAIYPVSGAMPATMVTTARVTAMVTARATMSTTVVGNASAAIRGLAPSQMQHHLAPSIDDGASVFAGDRVVAMIRDAIWPVICYAIVITTCPRMCVAALERAARTICVQTYGYVLKAVVTGTAVFIVGTMDAHVWP